MGREWGFNAQDSGPLSCIGLRFSIARYSLSATCLPLSVYMLAGVTAIIYP